MSKKLENLDKVNEICESLAQVRRSDFFQLKSRFSRLNKAQNPGDKKWLELEQRINASIQDKTNRLEARPHCEFDSSLPINQYIGVITHALKNHSVTVVCGETGSGKTTQLPKICLEMGQGIEGKIGHTQPRRLAARTVAKRISEELHSELGEHVGYKIRHQDKTAKQTYIKLMTDGILLAEMQQDRFLNQYDTLIIDEAHERSLNIDFILGYLKQLLPKRPDLKVIITSATIDVQRFSEHFNNAPIIEVSGRTYPVDVLYRPEDEDESLERNEHILNAIKELTSFDMGDILIFMEGEGEIHETDKFLRKQKLRDTDILPLYSRLSSSRQNKIFAPHKRRHIVLATNVAETSLTIPGIRYVIDTGMARISRYSYRSKVQRLPIEKISRAAAEQRKGRCGRTSEGICIRLYSEEDFNARQEFTQPEILRTNLASVILQMKSLKLGEIAEFPFIEPPDKKFVNDGLRVLREINAIDANDMLTSLGRKIARLPLDPRYARILMAADEFNCLGEILIIVSALSIQDPRERPIDNAEKADKAHEQFVDENSDFLWFINIWQFYHKQMKKLSQNKMRKLCQQNFLSYMRMREWLDIHRQLRHMCTELNLSINSDQASYQNIHCAILSGMPSHVAFLSDKHEYTGARDISLYLFPASGQFNKKPKWIVAAELVETSRLFARNVARIESQWVINTAKHLLKYEYSDAVWETKSARVIALEKVSLYGMTLMAGKKVNYGQVKPAEARTIFIRHALVEGDFASSAAFYKHNNRIINDIRKLETKTRRPDILNEEAIYDFYLKHIPDDVYDEQSFATWLKKLNKEQKEALFLNKDAVVTDVNQEKIDDLFPDVIHSQSIKIPVEYKLTPGEIDDGVNVELPLQVLNQLDENTIDYLVPGMLEEKIMLLLKSLPKYIRKILVPIPTVARECAENISNHKISLKRNLANYLYRTRSLDIQDSDWSESVLPEHLKINFRVVDAENNLVEQSKDLSFLKQKLASESEQAFHQAVEHTQNDEEVSEWNFGDLPVSKKIKINDNDITVYPSIIEEEGKVYIHAFDSRETAEYYLKYGLRALFKLAIAKELKYLRKNLRKLDKLALLYAGFGSKEELLDAIVNLVIDETYLYERTLIRKREQFMSKLVQGESRLLLNAENICRLLEKILQLYHKVIARLSESDVTAHEFVTADIEEQMDYMLYAGFIDDVSLKYLNEYPRYLESIMKRLEKLEYSVEKDRKNTLLIQEHWNHIKKLVDNAYETNSFSELLDEYRWMIEELRISLFTQELKTKLPVSIKRMDKMKAKLQKSELSNI